MLEELIQQHDSLIENIQEYSLLQKEFWQQIPWYAIEAEGRSGWGDGAEFNLGLYGVPHSHGYKGGAYAHLCVDLATGELHGWLGQHKARAEDILSIAPYIEELNGELVLEQYKEAAQRNHWSGYDVEEHDRIREGYRAQLGIGKIFDRSFVKPKLTIGFP